MIYNPDEFASIVNALANALVSDPALVATLDTQELAKATEPPRNFLVFVGDLRQAVQALNSALTVDNVVSDPVKAALGVERQIRVFGVLPANGPQTASEPEFAAHVDKMRFYTMESDGVVMAQPIAADDLLEAQSNLQIEQQTELALIRDWEGRMPDLRASFDFLKTLIDQPEEVDTKLIEMLEHMLAELDRQARVTDSLHDASDEHAARMDLTYMTMVFSGLLATLASRRGMPLHKLIETATNPPAPQPQ